MQWFLTEDYICRENSWQIAKIDYLFSVNLDRRVCSLLDICRENLCLEMYLLKLRK